MPENTPQKIWYHGGFSHFKEFDEKRSGSGSFHFAESREFAESYARTRSQDEEGDYDIVVREFHLTEKLFDFRNNEHLQALRSVLPETLSIDGNYGWAAWGGPQQYSADYLIESIQGIQVPFVGIDQEHLDGIRSGTLKRFRRDGGIDCIVSYDSVKDVVEYAPAWQMDSVEGAKSQIAFLQSTYDEAAANGNLSDAELKRKQDWIGTQIKLKELDLRGKQKSLRTYFLELNPGKKDGYDNWSILESQELRPYLQQLGFEGALMQESRKTTVVVFDNAHIKLLEPRAVESTPSDDDFRGPQ